MFMGLVDIVVETLIYSNGKCLVTEGLNVVALAG